MLSTVPYLKKKNIVLILFIISACAIRKVVENKSTTLLRVSYYSE